MYVIHVYILYFGHHETKLLTTKLNSNRQHLTA